MLFDPARYPNGTKKRRHHNNKGARQVKQGKVYDQVRAMASRLGIPYLFREEGRRAKGGYLTGE